VKPPEDGRGPTKSTCMWENLRCGTSIWSGGECAWRRILPRWQDWHSLVHLLMSAAILPQTNLSDIIRREALAPGWATPCMAEKTGKRRGTGTSGRRCGVEASHHNCKSPMETFTSLSEEECRSDCTSGQSICLTAMSLKSMPVAGIGGITASVEDSGRTTAGGIGTGLLRRLTSGRKLWF